MKIAQRFGEDSPQEVIGFHKSSAMSEIQRMIEKYFVRVVAIFDLGDEVGVVFEEMK